jgi:transcriptional regulator
VARAIEDRDWLAHLVTRLSNKHEASQSVPWHVSQAPADYLDKMLSAIVGIEIPIDKLVGKFKLSQNRSRADQEGVVAGLLAQGDAESIATAELIKHKLD